MDRPRKLYLKQLLPPIALKVLIIWINHNFNQLYLEL